jgi:glycine/D-amino acid oxidase-like deaminating enzyme
VIGGGLTGLSCAYHLCKLGKSVVVLEQRGLCDGATVCHF